MGSPLRSRGTCITYSLTLGPYLAYDVQYYYKIYTEHIIMVFASAQFVIREKARRDVIRYTNIIIIILYSAARAQIFFGRDPGGLQNENV